MAVKVRDDLLPDYDPKAEGYIDGKKRANPHNNPDRLHAPYSCRRCDAFPIRQRERAKQRINYTGEYDTSKKVCPSERIQ